MTNAKRDNNRVPTALAALYTDPTIVLPLIVNPSTNRLMVNQMDSDGDLGTTNAKRDENRITGIVGVSSADFTTPVVAYCDGAGRLLVNPL